MTTSVRFLGFAAFEITTPEGTVVLIDPFLKDNPVSPLEIHDLERVDLILVTHLAADHLGDAAEIAIAHHAPVICGPEVKVFIEEQGVNPDQITAVPWGVQVVAAGIQVRAVECHHTSFRKSPKGNYLSGPPLSFIITTEPDVRIYHSGDTALFSDLKMIGELHCPNVGLMCACKLEDTYMASLSLDNYLENEMNGSEGAIAAHWLGVDTAVICHYMNPDGQRDVEDFFAKIKEFEVELTRPMTALAPPPGDVITFP